MAQFITAQEAAKLIPDGAIVGIAGMGLSGWAEEVGRAIRDSYRETGHPCDLTLKQGCAMGDWKTRGVTVLGEAGPGLVTNWLAAHIGSAFSLNEQVQAGQIKCHCLPQGVIINLWREIAAGRPGLITKVGLGTFVDPRVEGGRMNPETTEDACELIEFDGEEYLFYRSFPLDVAILRGTTADEKGNISFEHESVMNEGLAVASAAKNSGGIVIVQVEYLAQAGSLNPKDVAIPGIMVDYVVQATDKDCCWRTEGVYYEPAFSGQIKKPLSQLPVLDLSPRKVICRRCAMELQPGAIVNLGVGIPADVASVVAESGYLDEVTITAAAGASAACRRRCPTSDPTTMPRRLSRTTPCSTSSTAAAWTSRCSAWPRSTRTATSTFPSSATVCPAPAASSTSPSPPRPSSSRAPSWPRPRRRSRTGGSR